MTADANLPSQQDLAKLDIAVVILAAGMNRMSTYEPLAERLLALVASAAPGEASWLRS